MAGLAGRVAFITGAGGGVGRATALALATDGMEVVLAGRTEETLRETAVLIGDATGRAPEEIMVAPCDVAVAEQVEAAVRAAHERYGRLDLVLNNAGINVPRRSLAEMALEDWRRIVAIDLDGCYHCVRAALPLMRAQGGGLFVHIGSKSVRRPSPLAGAAYTAAKAGLAGLSAVINAEEGARNIRSTVIVLGDTDTALLDDRPTPPSAEVRALLLQPEDVAACVRLLAALPDRAMVEELVLYPTHPL